MKLRIISGTIKGAVINTPSGQKTHPMSEKIRGAIFNILGDISGLTVFDGYTGSGAIALEAVSRGASGVTAIEIDKKAFNIAKENALSLKSKNLIKFSKANVSSWSDNNIHRLFDIVILDPPYADIKVTILNKIIERHVAKSGLSVLALPSDINFPIPKTFEVVQQKIYGNASLIFLKRITLEK